MFATLVALVSVAAASPVINCFAEPCSVTKCAVGTTCVANLNSCTAHCVAEPECFADPCSVATCASGLTCERIPGTCSATCKSCTKVCTKFCVK
ncbi:hypothetical protein HDU91_001556, partial [Kappamyces sp. JEL0680]